MEEIEDDGYCILVDGELGRRSSDDGCGSCSDIEDAVLMGGPKKVRGCNNN